MLVTDRILRHALLLSLLFCIVGAAPSEARCLQPDLGAQTIGGFQEVVISVADLSESISDWRDIGGFRVVCASRRRTDAALWSRDKRLSGREVVLAKTAAPNRYVRLVAFDGQTAPMIRPSGMPWDIGGVFDLYVIVADVDAVLAALRRRGWQSYTDPISYDGTYRGVRQRVREAIARGPNGEVLVLMQRSPAPEGASYFGSDSGISWPYNGAIVVSDLDEAMRFFQVGLEWKLIARGDFTSPPPGETPTGLPFNLAMANPRMFAAFANDEVAPYASIQALQFSGLVGRNFESRATAPNRGILALRIPVENVEALRDRFAAKLGVVSELRSAEIAPYGRVRILTVSGPSGARFDFFERLQQ